MKKTGSKKSRDPVPLTRYTILYSSIDSMYSCVLRNKKNVSDAEDRAGQPPGFHTEDAGGDVDWHSRPLL